MSEEKNNSDRKNSSDYEYISDLTTIAGQEKASFDSVVNWTLMLNLAGFGFLISRFFSDKPKPQNTSVLLWTISVLFFFTVAFAIRAWRSYRNYYNYCMARYDELKNSQIKINKLDTRGRSDKKPCFLEFLIGTEFIYLVLVQFLLYRFVLFSSSLLNCNYCLPMIIVFLASACYICINYLIYRRHKPKNYN